MDILKLGDNSFQMPLNASWNVTYYEEDSSKADIRFNTGKYPVFGLKILSIDDPKSNKHNKLKEHLFDPILLETHPDLEIKTSNNEIYGLEYEANLESGEKVKVWRKAKIIGSRTVRLITLALSWTSNPSSDQAVKTILADIEQYLEKCSFIDSETELDKEAKVAGRISRLKLEKISPWEGCSLLMPSSWPTEINKDKKSLISRVTGYEEAMLFLNCDEITLPKETKITIEYMQHTAASLGADENVKDVSLHSTEENVYLISCAKSEVDGDTGVILNNYFWHIFAPKGNTLCRLHFTYVFPGTGDKFLHSLVSVLGNNIKNISLV